MSQEDGNYPTSFLHLTVYLSHTPWLVHLGRTWLVNSEALKQGQILVHSNGTTLEIDSALTTGFTDLGFRFGAREFYYSQPFTH